jgi:uncharacterized integral membrane protein
MEVATLQIKQTREDVTMQRFKLIALLVLVMAAIILVQQNTEPVETRILFLTVTMPRAVLLMLTLMIGFACGILVALGIGKRRRPSIEPEQRKTHKDD